MQASWVIGASGMPSELNALPCTECEWAAAITSGRACMDCGVQHECGAVHRAVAVDDIAGVVDQDQIARPDVPEAEAERVDPEVVGELRVADGDVAGDPFTETEPSEDAQRAGELGLAVGALLVDARRTARAAACRPLFGRERDAVDRAHVVSVIAMPQSLLLGPTLDDAPLATLSP